MHMADQPYDCGCERHEKKQKNNPTFPSVFAKPPPPSKAPARVERLSTLHRYRNVQPLLRLVASRSAFVCQRSRIVFCWRGSPGNNPFEPLEFLTQLRFLPCDVLLPATKRRGRSVRR